MKKIIFSLVTVIILGMMPADIHAEEEKNVKAAILMEVSTGKVLYEQNPDEQLSIASVTKIMTMLLIMERIDAGALALDDIVTASDNAQSYGGSTMFLEAGERFTVSDMLKGIAVASANDGCAAMAEHISGSESAFVELMNKRADELGMSNTHFANTNGLDADGHYSTARDVAVMSRELIKHPKIFDYTTIWTDSLRDGKFALANTNKLVRFYNGATGLKTGSTSKAGCCLSATAQRDGMELIAVVLGAPDTKTRFSTARELLDYGFAGYSVKKELEKGEPVGKVQVYKGTSTEVGVAVKDGYSYLVSKVEPITAEKTVKIQDKVTAPVNMGDKLGEICFKTSDGNETVIDIIATEDVEKKGVYLIFLDILHEFIEG